MQTTANAIAAAKLVYLQAFRNQMMMKASPFYAKIERQQVVANEFSVAAKVGQIGGFGAMTEGGTLPTTGAQNYMKFTGTLKNLFVPVRITDKAIEISKSAAGSSFENLLGQEMKGAFETAKINVSRMVVAGNGTGILTTVTDTDGDSATITVANYRPLDIGITIDIYKADHTKIGTRRIIGIDRTASTITVDSVIDTVASTSYITLQLSKGNEITGLDAIFNSGVTSYMGNLKSATPAIVPTSVDAQQDLTSALIADMISDSDDYRSGNTDMILCGARAFREYTDYLEGMKQVVKTVDLVGGFKGVSFLHEDREIAIVREKFVAPTEMIGVNTKDFKELHLGDWDYLAQEDSAKLGLVSGTDYFETVIRKYCELVCQNPGAMWKLTNVCA
jgi:hypothetical protein